MLPSAQDAYTRALTILTQYNSGVHFKQFDLFYTRPGRAALINLVAENTSMSQAVRCGHTNMDPVYHDKTQHAQMTQPWSSAEVPTQHTAMLPQASSRERPTIMGCYHQRSGQRCLWICARSALNIKLVGVNKTAFEPRAGHSRTFGDKSIPVLTPCPCAYPQPENLVTRRDLCGCE